MIGSTISHFKILEKLGEGGMGVVYKAQDTKLNRAVALKFLPEHLSASEQEKARFLQEARAAASLNHPNICTIYGIDEYDGRLFIAMELVEGQSMRDNKQPISVKQAIDIGAQIADGLAAAHEKGIVHRDIKPENIMIRKDGIVQIMDFGLAKLRGSTRLTTARSLLGTVGYMSPEQVQGLDIDHRTDIFSLGIILYEFISGQSPFNGVHEAAIIYEIVNVNPKPISAIIRTIDIRVEQVVLKCLEKEQTERYQSVKDVAVDLRRIKRDSDALHAFSAVRDMPYSTPSTSSSDRSTDRIESATQRKRQWLWVLAATVFFCSTALFAIRDEFFQSSTAPFTVKALILPAEIGTLSSTGPLTLSPDGHRLVFSGRDANGKKLLWIRSIDDVQVRQLPGTDDASYPFWSPDSRSLGFFAEAKLKRLDVEGGSVVTICEAREGLGGSWSSDGSILFAPSSQSPIFRVPASGGTAVALTQLDTIKQETSHRWPYFLPDGRHFLFLSRTTTTGVRGDADAISVASLDGKERKFVVQSTTNAAYADGYVLCTIAGKLMALPFNPAKLVTEGDPISLVERIQIDAGDGSATFSVSNTNLLTYQFRSSLTGSQLIMFDLSGKEEGHVGDQAAYWDVRFSPNGKLLAYALNDRLSGNLDIWIYELSSRSKTRFTYNNAPDRLPVWSHDGTQLVFASNRKGVFDLYRKKLGTGQEELLFESNENKQPFDWSADGRFLAYVTTTALKTRSDIWVLPIAGDRTPIPFLRTEANEWDPHFSPDGKWMTYCSDESGRNEIYVRPFPGPGNPWQISPSGGSRPRWTRDGLKIFYMDPQSYVMLTEVAAKDSRVEVGKSRVLFHSYPKEYAGVYDVSPEGRRVVVNSLGTSEISPPTTLTVNWTALVKKK
ncbi:MAG: protein kinase [Ignavibacteriales bacterium]|nr:protein kinase [Ignavibacteriales bacterium]